MANRLVELVTDPEELKKRFPLVDLSALKFKEVVKTSRTVLASRSGVIVQRSHLLVFACHTFTPPTACSARCRLLSSSIPPIEFSA